MLTELKSYLEDAKYLHKMLEWGQAWGLLIGFAALLISICLLRDKKALLFSSGLVLLSCLSVWPAEELRSKPGPVDTERAAATNKQSLLRKRYAWAFYLEAGVMAAAMAAAGNSGKFGRVLLALGAAGAVATAGLAFWLQARELQIAYPILRSTG